MMKIGGLGGQFPIQPEQQKSSGAKELTTSVKLGEKNLSQVAQRLGVPEDLLVKANPSLSNISDLKAGHEISVPSSLDSTQSTVEHRTPGSKKYELLSEGRMIKNKIADLHEGIQKAGVKEPTNNFIVNHLHKANIYSRLEQWTGLKQEISQSLHDVKISMDPKVESVVQFENELGLSDKTFGELRQLLDKSDISSSMFDAFTSKVKQHAAQLTHLHGQITEFASTANSSQRIDLSGLSETIKEAEIQQEQIRNKKQMATTAFENFNQKANQMFNMLSSVMKAMNEMRGIGAASNIL